MSSTIKHTASRNAGWRQRMEQKAAAARAEADRIEAELDRAKYARTNENFPATLVSTAHPRNQKEFGRSFAQKADAWRADDAENATRERLRRARSAFERRGLIRDIFIYRRKNKLSDIDLDDEDEFVDDFRQVLLNETWPPHGRRGRYSDADDEGWREVTRYWRARKPRTTQERVLGDESGDDNTENDSHNGDLFEDHRRDFY